MLVCLSLLSIAFFWTNGEPRYAPYKLPMLGHCVAVAAVSAVLHRSFGSQSDSDDLIIWQERFLLATVFASGVTYLAYSSFVDDLYGMAAGTVDKFSVACLAPFSVFLIFLPVVVLVSAPLYWLPTLQRSE